MTGVRLRAPELTGRAWLNTAGRRLSLTDLRGSVVVLDFWTFCCVNCLHVLDELRPLEDTYADVLVVVGVHSPKFVHERDPAALAAAVERYGVSHPVLDDPDLHTWRQYTARAWPTLAVIDPEGYLVASMAGEGHAEGLRRLIDELVKTHEERGTLRRGAGARAVAGTAPAQDGQRPGEDGADGTTLRFPGKALPLPDGGFLVSDSARHRLVTLAPDAATVSHRIGTGARGRLDGPAGAAQFCEPQGLCRLPPHVADAAGYEYVVADTVNHLLRGVAGLHSSERDGIDVRTVAGTGRQWRGEVDRDAHDALSVDLSSPWDVAWFDNRVIIAMAGIHQLWWFDPVAGTAGVWAGTTVEGLRDGPLAEAWFAQPSGLSVSPDGVRLWIADSETSALRWVERGELHTAVGEGLFDFGHADGDAASALLQHPLGVAAMPDGAVLIADTYNGAVRRYDPTTSSVSTVATGLAEPSDLVLTGDGTVLVVESAAHRLSVLHPAAVHAPDDPLTSTVVVPARLRTERPRTALAAGEVELAVVFTPGPGQKLDESYGPATRLEVTSSPPDLLRKGAGAGTELSRTLVLDGAIGEGVLQVVAQAATCDADAAHPACHLTRQDWGVPVTVAAGGAARLPLVLRGME
jgi:thiol-disulfide isomerase/thioredoxin